MLNPLHSNRVKKKTIIGMGNFDRGGVQDYSTNTPLPVPHFQSQFHYKISQLRSKKPSFYCKNFGVRQVVQKPKDMTGVGGWCALNDLYPPSESTTAQNHILLIMEHSGLLLILLDGIQVSLIIHLTTQLVYNPRLTEALQELSILSRNTNKMIIQGLVLCP